MLKLKNHIGYTEILKGVVNICLIQIEGMEEEIKIMMLWVMVTVQTMNGQ